MKEVGTRTREVVQGTDACSMAVADGGRQMSDEPWAVRERTWWKREGCC